MVTELYWPESSQIIQKHVEDFEGFGMVWVKSLSQVTLSALGTEFAPNVTCIKSTEFSKVALVYCKHNV